MKELVRCRGERSVWRGLCSVLSDKLLVGEEETTTILCEVFDGVQIKHVGQEPGEEAKL